MTAVTRLLLDNIARVQTPWPHHHMTGETAMACLAFGAVLVEGACAAPPPAPPAKTAEAAVRAIREAGFMPVERDGAYRTVPRNQAESQATPETGILKAPPGGGNT